jgi:hypothetical protein
VSDDNVFGLIYQIARSIGYEAGRAYGLGLRHGLPQGVADGMAGAGDEGDAEEEPEQIPQQRTRPQPRPINHTHCPPQRQPGSLPNGEVRRGPGRPRKNPQMPGIP